MITQLVNALYSNSSSSNALSLRMLLPEPLWLEPEHFTQARRISSRFSREQDQWQAYIHALAQFAFQDWLQDKFPNVALSAVDEPGEEGLAVGYLDIASCRLCLIAKEQVLDEVVVVPRAAVDHPAQCAHYYVWIEVLEDQQEAVVRGFLRYDELIEQLDRSFRKQPADEAYVLPLAVLDDEPNHLVGYLQQLSPSAIALPTAAASAAPQTPAQAAVQQAIEQTVQPAVQQITQLSAWLEGTLTSGWQTIDSLINPEMSLAWATRSRLSETKAGKLINLGVQLSEQAVVLLVTVVPEEDEKVGVNIQVLPTGDQALLPPQLSVTLLSGAGKVLQEVVSREADNFVQLRSFKGKPGIRFSVELSLDDMRIHETFVL